MPLPDERPRQSVANLIGRFEQKRQSMSGIQLPPGSLRSTSVASHTTGDSVKEEILQKREWPPRSTATDEGPDISSTSSSIQALPIPQSKSPPIIEAVSLPSAEPPATEVVVSPPNAEPTKALRQSTLNTKSSSVRKANSTPAKALPLKATATVKAPQKSPIRSPPQNSSVLSPPKSQTLKPQHTGTSTKSTAAVSTPSGTKYAKSSSKATPNRPKTPSATNVRPKTPSNTTPRPRTPSSGLFAPTAASLAKSRNAAPPLPTPVKKATLSSSAADRLSKPTAASISKVRSPTVSPAVKTAKGSMSSPARAATVAAKATVKPRVGLPSTKVKGAATGTGQSSNGAAKVVAGVAAAAATVAITASVVGGDIVGVRNETEAVEHHDEEVAANDHHAEPSEYLKESHGQESFERHVEEPEQISQDLENEDVSHEFGLEGSVDVEDAEVERSSVLLDLPPSHSPKEHPDELDRELEPEVGGEDINADEAITHDTLAEEPHYNTDIPSPPPIPAEDAEDAHIDNVTEPPVPAGDDIDGIVDLLETVPAVLKRPLSVPSIPDDAPDIPDED